ncbi:isoform cra b [Ophiostoma piceae UAMH 11346]|uniref:Isoform cra b n=1 Tax=Ophiostoma piceae (strain UAMH 11346) TaxID=1262450 RepID=S3CRC9_OPHP1|nr:isoform cra b [Ophiostoma piceae UAMH 11346]
MNRSIRIVRTVALQLPQACTPRQFSSLALAHTLPLSPTSQHQHHQHQRQRCRRHRSLQSQPRFFSSSSDTIYALSSGAGKAGIAVIRVSGPACLNIYGALCPAAPRLRPRYAAVRTLYGPKSSGEAGEREILDSNALVLFFPGPKSVTGEDVLELHVHGGTATVKAVLSALPATLPRPSAASTSAAVRYAEPGEFTRRAFFHNRLDLAQVESLGDTLDAATEQQRRIAVRGSTGRLGQTYDEWRSLLLYARAEIEALIDFSEDQHFEETEELLGRVSTQVLDLKAKVQKHESAADRTTLLKSGIRIALVGPANAGKSSLMNLVVGREASIVSHEAGTTRDVVEASLDIRGYLCTFADTAGFRQSQEHAVGSVEAEGIRRARQKAADADIVVVLASFETDAGGTVGISYDRETLQLAKDASRHMVVLNKRDVVGDETYNVLASAFCSDIAKVTGVESELAVISCARDEGIHTLVDRLAETFASMTDLPPDEQDLLGVTARQQQLLAECRGYLDDFLAETEPGMGDPDVVLAAEHLRYAADCLSRITGRGDAGDIEEVLGVIFEK